MISEMLQSIVTDAGAKLLLALGLLLGGILAGKLLGFVVKKLLKAFKLKEALASINAEPAFLGIDLVELIKLFTEWYTYLYFIMAAMMVLEVPALAAFIDEIKALAVLLVEAVVVAYIGLQVAGFLRKGLKTYSKSSHLGDIVYYVAIYLTIILALTSVYPQAASLLNYLLLVLVASAGLGLSLGLGISLGLGTKELVSKVARKYVKPGR
ncbi:MAG TPA: hypothetical protein ENN60_00640 [archaeon]|nr:hypothetical protein [archaeon]